MDKLRVAIVGCGFMGRMHANVYRLLENAELVAVVDKDPIAASKVVGQKALRVYPTLDELLTGERVDAIDICLPTDLHAAFTVKAAAAGKHVFCEKPMALSVEDGLRMKQACESAAVRLMIGHCIRYWPEYAYLKQLVDEERLGELLSLSLLRYGAFPAWASENWMADERRSGGGALDMHIHDTDFARYVLGEPTSVDSLGTRDSRGVSHIFTTMTFGAKIAHIEGGWNLPAKTPFKHAFRAVFERGAAIMDSGPLTVYEEGFEPIVVDFPKMEAAGGGNISDLGGYYFELKDFVEKILSGEAFTVTTPESSLGSLGTVLQEIELVDRTVHQRGL